MSDINIPGSPGTAMALAAGVSIYSAALVDADAEITKYFLLTTVCFIVATIFIELLHRVTKVSTGKNVLSLSPNDEKTKVDLKIDDDRTYEFTIKTENGKLNIYEGTKPYIPNLCTHIVIILFLAAVLVIPSYIIVYM